MLSSFAFDQERGRGTERGGGTNQRRDTGRESTRVRSNAQLPPPSGCACLSFRKNRSGVRSPERKSPGSTRIAGSIPRYTRNIPRSQNLRKMLPVSLFAHPRGRCSKPTHRERERERERKRERFTTIRCVESGFRSDVVLRREKANTKVESKLDADKGRCPHRASGALEMLHLRLCMAHCSP